MDHTQCIRGGQGMNPYGNVLPYGGYPGIQGGPTPGFGASPFGASPYDATGFSPLGQGMGMGGPMQAQQMIQLLMMLVQLLQMMVSQGPGGQFGAPFGGGGVGNTPGFGGGGNYGGGIPGNYGGGNPGGGYGAPTVGGNQDVTGGGQQSANDVPLSGNEADRIEQVAKTQLGDPYVFGAPRTPDNPNPSSFDCSSFTQWVMKQATGKSIPGTAETQWNALKGQGKLNTGNWGNWQKGDIIFFQNTYKPGISHVGIYIGDGKMVQASGGNVKVSDLANSSYYRQHYAGSGHV
ncbi:MAG: C40 family peptidase [Armatimonadetes bacterium]|nr:C40 family peptidase [Armatimonadota bacterium]